MGGQLQLNHKFHLKLAWELLKNRSPLDVVSILSVVLPVMYENESPHLHGYRHEGTKRWVESLAAKRLEGEKFEEFVERCPEFWDITLVTK